MKLIETNFAVKIECTKLSKRVIDWFNKTFKMYYEGRLDYYYVCENGKDYFKTDPKDIKCEIITETEFLKRLDLEQTPENVKPIFTLDNTAGEIVRDRNVLIPIEILLKEYCETHNLDLNLCKAI